MIAAWLDSLSMVAVQTKHHQNGTPTPGGAVEGAGSAGPEDDGQEQADLGIAGDAATSSKIRVIALMPRNLDLSGFLVGSLWALISGPRAAEMDESHTGIHV
ncbi:hypothetical protein Asppvi_003905 [Aspergillus pseudoviridinutans]|uniref:Uncharacterized protein n=1 Tax=Aspergillus pseudoviridinutans TaxID=1517512 RepID=A0A9P3B970_9EURO|nr:uncharacterized protein Asppvi_003905 [Aspergillus pseudoviridinutans]GIJ85050.1 hypothetical protein Asppvi_003905 [Aspergillus pseudoviridinutans]